MEFKETEVFNFEGALRGMRNPKNSWDKSDSYIEYDEWDQAEFIIGNNDMKLAQQLIRAGSEHRKFLRQIFTSVDITAPLYWWKEFDTYKLGTTANSTSTMHKITSNPITSDCFERNDRVKEDNYFLNFINHLESLRKDYIETKDNETWKQLIQELPSSWLQTRTITMNYENLYSMIRQREHHKLSEWRELFIDWCKTLPYANELLFLDLEKEDKNN